MRKPWYKRIPDQYEALCREIEDVYPELHVIEREPGVYAAGYYPLYDGTRVWDRYHIEVAVPEDSCTGLPRVRELDGRIPRTADRHMETDGTACVVLPDAFWYEYPEGMSLRAFLEGPVRSFFANQSLIERGVTGTWDTGEWGHGADGIIEFYGPLLGTEDAHVIQAHLNLLKRETIKGHWLCPCGSGEKLRTCHRPLINELRERIPRAVAARSAKRLTNVSPWRDKASFS